MKLGSKASLDCWIIGIFPTLQAMMLIQWVAPLCLSATRVRGYWFHYTYQCGLFRLFWLDSWNSRAAVLHIPFLNPLLLLILISNRNAKKSPAHPPLRGFVSCVFLSSYLLLRSWEFRCIISLWFCLIYDMWHGRLKQISMATFQSKYWKKQHFADSLGFLEVSLH